MVWLHRLFPRRKRQPVLSFRPRGVLDSQELLTNLTRGFAEFRARDEQTILLIGRVFSAILLIESKLDRLLGAYFPDIKHRMLGRKIDALCDFLSAAEASTHGPDPEDIHFTRELVSGLRELAKLRGRIAHDLGKMQIDRGEIHTMSSIVRRHRGDLYASIQCDDPAVIAIAIVTFFAFVVSVDLAFYEQVLE